MPKRGCFAKGQNAIVHEHTRIGRRADKPRDASPPVKEPAENVLKDIRRATRRQFSAEEKNRIVREGLRGEESIVGLYRREGIGRSKYFLVAGQKRLAGDNR